MNYSIEDNVFTGILPDGDITHNEDEFFDTWSEEFDQFPEAEEDW